MPKINVYLPDELAEAVKEASVPISAVCQRALEQSVKRVGAVRGVVVGDLTDDGHSAALAQFTQRARDALKLGVVRAREAGLAEVGTGHLLYGMLTEGANLGLHVLRSVEIAPEQVLRELDRSGPEMGKGSAERLSRTAVNALELAVTEAISLGHNYVGCEHLLLGLLAEPDGTAGRVLRELGVELRTTRHAVVAALAAYVHLRNQQAGSPEASLSTVVEQALQPIVARLERLEERVGQG